MPETPLQQARNFIDNETEFHLGFLPTEQSHPLTRSLERDFQNSTTRGVATLQKPDRDVLDMARRVLSSNQFDAMVGQGVRTVRGGGRLIFSGCGATGRLAILLESMWRGYFAEHPDEPNLAEAAASIMTGGDYALIKSVESFEDFQSFGRRQAAELDIGPADMLIAITEGGETSSVIGTVKESAERGAAVWLLFNNPAALLREHLIRCREVIDDPRVTVLELSCGPMALAGSTRMQATTSEQLVAGAFLEAVLARLRNRPAPDAANQFAAVLDELEAPDSIREIAAYIDFECEVYRQQGRITYLAADYLLDIFTDTTERSPTFMLPPFRRRDDAAAPPPWAFVKNPLCDTRSTWRTMLHRPPRCLAWTPDDYRRMGGGDRLIAQPPRIDAAAIYEFEVGNEAAPERFDSPASGAVTVTVTGAPHNAALLQAAAAYPVLRRLEMTTAVPDTALHLARHMKLKLLLNTVSTGAMVKLGRVSGNWMSYVSISNKKLIDRGIRLVAELGGLSYDQACLRLFEAAAELDREDWSGREKPSAVQRALRGLHHSENP